MNDGVIRRRLHQHHTVPSRTDSNLLHPGGGSALQEYGLQPVEISESQQDSTGRLCSYCID
jgi:hypothetical protein